MKCFISLLLASVINSATLNFDWEVKEGRIAPDNFAFEGILFNGQYPAPTINATAGDTIVVKVRNRLNKDFSIHWHGMVQKGTVGSDGVPYVSSPPIKPGEDFLYNFHVNDQTGTWWYHAHTGLDAEHAYGALIVQDKKDVWSDIVKFDPRYRYDEDRVVMLSEIWHKPSDEMLKGLLELPFRFVGGADSILTNGMTYKVWDTKGADNSTVPFNKGFNVIDVKPNKRYRLRLIGANGLSFLTFRIPGHKFTLIEADGTIIEPIEVDRVEIGPGQRYSVIMETNQPISNYYTYTQVSGGSANPNNGVAILHYEGAENPSTLKRTPATPPTPTGPFNRWVESQLATSKWYNKGLNSHFYPVPKKVTNEIVLNIISATHEGHPIFTINDVVSKPRNSTVWDDVIAGRHKATPGVYEITEGEVVQLVLQHYMPAGRTCASHPWHLHGHSFFVVGQGAGVYNPEVDGKAIDAKLSTSNKIPIYRDTFIQYANNVKESARSATNQLSDTLGVRVNNENSNENLFSFGNSRVAADDVPCGWYAIRFNADNPGSWFMHCHITAHLVMGKQLVINENFRK
ncbi:hypothetical protein K502DRAFT_361302 [Neoconidiobolus thromboides FSU 785]|nr:hypothetical protein K502DRAFT_365983 [Neoconidiobolus thromboides FSU 785]KAI9294545.1 hypothetical protein K502DRAFT_361302 [Neoconidiobolus thromboides FSU 785]